MAYDQLTLEITDKVALVTMNRPDRLNALSAELVAELKQAVTEISAEDSGARCLVLTGAGRGFSSGADLAGGGDMNAEVPDLSKTLRERYHPLIEALDGLPMPMIAAVNGPAAGAGMSLALAADFIVAARSAYFLQAFVNIGLAPDAGSTYYLPRLIGPARARELMMLGEKLTAETAAQWGLVYKLADDAAVVDEAMALGRRLAAGPTKSLAGIRKLARASLDNDLGDQLELEAETQKELGLTQDFKAGVMAFLSKQKATFTGR